jgi:hypothetical protein
MLVSVFPAPNAGHDATMFVLIVLAGCGGVNALMSGGAPPTAVQSAVYVSVPIESPVTVQVTPPAVVAPFDVKANPPM